MRGRTLGPCMGLPKAAPTATVPTIVTLQEPSQASVFLHIWSGSRPDLPTKTLVAMTTRVQLNP